MGSRGATGYGLLAVGVLILIFTFYEAYAIFQGVMSGTFAPLNQQPAQSAPAVNSNSSLQSTINAAISSAFANLHFGGYAESLIILVVLALFASIGYKFAKLGISLIGLQGGQPEDSGSKKSK